MDSDTKKMLQFGILIALVALFAVGFFVWGLISKGTLILQGEVPFTATIFDETTVECVASPCEITLSSGKKSILIAKEGFRSIFIEPEIKTWRTTAMDLDFQILPSLIEVDTLPGTSKINNYQIVDDDNGMQKLINSDDPAANAIVYFQKSLSNPQLVGDGRYLLIIDDNNIFKVDTGSQTRTEIFNLNPSDLSDISAGKWSPDGRYLIFTRKDSPKLSLLDTNAQAIKQLFIWPKLELVDWFYNDTLVFITNQSYSTSSGADADGNSYTDFLEGLNTDGYIVGFYYPRENLYSRLDMTSQILEEPQKIVALANGQSLYLLLGEKNFRIILRKF